MREWDIPELFQSSPPNEHLILGIGDDAAVTSVPTGHQLVTSCDAALEGVHFPTGAPWDKVGYRAMVGALSDLAAMTATAEWVMISLSLPEPDDEVCRALAKGILEAAKEYQVAIIGGNTAAGPFNLSLTVMGFVPIGQSLTRHSACVGDGIYVTGTLGDAAYGLESVLGDKHQYESLFWRPTARFECKEWLHHIQASSCIDLSDGLIGDLGHILKASNVGADLQSTALPLSEPLKALARDKAIRLALTGGEDYELCFTAPMHLIQDFEPPVPVTQVGVITSDLYCKVDNQRIEGLCSYQHWKKS